MPEPATRPPAGTAPRPSRLLLSPRSRLALLVCLLAGAGAAAVAYEPHRLLAGGGWPRAGGAGAVVLFGLAYGLCTAAFVPRPVLNLASGALFGTQAGLAAAVAGTVLGAGVAFALGRALGRDALRPLLRGRWAQAADRQLGRHGFRSTLAIRLFPGVPFAAANYGAAVSRVGYAPFLLGTALGCVPNTAAYVVAGSHAAAPGSPAFLLSAGFVAACAAGGAVVAWRKRHRLRSAPAA
ncbi:TVP38/TMEM64 family protein [Streptomyces sudanensis]|uniref:TVP38/TMEM64 family protein n=1 Tax=Streptomyces sudanensis TaxID=436397 RepID=UPI0020CD0866|nr:TVP38/TMEM64 family protein [Streptomyces sudanensis]MCP9988854.1 TVP38/TMEM64 family protein [Streptomyces sudanensis]